MRSSLTRFTYRTIFGPTHKGWKLNQSHEIIPVVDPANGDIIAEVASASSNDVRDCVQSADTAFKSGVWSQSSVQFRSTVLTKMARILEQQVPQIAELETAQTGRTIREMRTQLSRLPEWLDYFAALVRVQQGIVAPTSGQLHNFIHRIPLGVVAQITPFNHPLLIAVKKLAPALAAGNSVVVKPSEHAPLSVLKLVDIALDAGLPEGVLSVVPGRGHDVGRNLISHPLVRKVDVTMGTKAGREVGKLVGENLSYFTAELGGKTPVIVFNDADLESAVNGVAFASFIASGQTCVSGSRIIVQSEIYDRFMGLFLSKVDQITRAMGDPKNDRSSMGSVISADHLSRIHKMVSSTSARIVAGGTPMTGKSALDGFDFSAGSFYPPTVITEASTEDDLWREEIFGPVVVVQKFRSDNVGISLANDSAYGLGASVWTSDIGKAHWAAAKLDCGIVWINTHHRNDPSSPWGGVKASGLGRENGLEALMSYTQSKSVIINTATVDTTKADDWFSGPAARYG